MLCLDVNTARKLYFLISVARNTRIICFHLFFQLPEGVQLTLSELREMACRQQAQIDSQHQLLAAKEQRLRYLKEQEARQQRVQAESERLRRLRDRVDAQELKLRKLRAIRGQVDHQKQNNLSLSKYMYMNYSRFLSIVIQLWPYLLLSYFMFHSFF